MDGTDNDACLLTYVFSTYPNPIQTSTAQTPLTARISIGVLNTSGKDIYCNELSAGVFVGTDANAFTAGPVKGSVNTGKWVPVTMKPDAMAQPAAPKDDSFANVTFDCLAKSDWLIKYNLVLELEAQVNQTPGAFTVVVSETSGTDQQNLTYKTASFLLTKETPQFYLQNLVTTTTASPLVPATEFSNGQDIRFAWESNGTFFQLYEKGSAAPIYSGSAKTFTLAGGVKTDTTFFLVGMMTGDPGGDGAKGGYEPVYLYDALTVTISNPSLAPASVTASGDIKTGGTLSAVTVLCAKSLEVDGDVKINHDSILNGRTVIGSQSGPDLTVNANSNFLGNVEVKGETDLSVMIVRKVAKLDGVTSLGQADAVSLKTGDLTVTNDLTVNSQGAYNAHQTFTGGVSLWGGQPSSGVSHLEAGGGRLYMGWLPSFSEASLRIKLSDDSGMIGYQSSSCRFKDDIHEFTDDFQKILQANPVSFVYKGEGAAGRSIGYIAEDFAALGLHDLLVYDSEGQPAVIKYDLIPLYHQEIIKGLQGKVATLQETVAAQAELVRALERRIVALEKKGSDPAPGRAGVVGS